VSRRIVFAVLAMATGQTAVYLVRPTTSYRLLGLDYGATAVGVVAAAFALVPLFLAIPLGRRADRRHGARLLLFGCAVETVGCVLLALARSAVSLGAASAVVGVGHLALALGSQAVVARESTDDRHDQHFALLTAGVSGGQLVGPLLGGLLLGHRSGGALLSATTRAMLVAAGVAALATALAAVAERGRTTAEADEADDHRASVRAILGTRGVAAAIFASVAVLSATDVFTAYLPVVGERRDIGPAVVGVLLALRAGASLACRIGIGRLVGRFGRIRLMTAAAGAAAAAFTGLTFTGNVAVLAALAVVVGAGLGFAQPLSMTIVVQLVPDSWRASALAVRLTGNRLGQVAAPAAAGLVAGSAGASSVFWMTSGLLVASGLAVAKRPEAIADEVERRDEHDGDRLADELAGA
jgi:MFS family permease